MRRTRSWNQSLRHRGRDGQGRATRSGVALVAVLVAVGLTTSCSAGSANERVVGTPGALTSAAQVPPDGAGSRLAADDPYVHLARSLQERGVKVWFETDLVSRWLEGPQPFAKAVARDGELARLPGVQGLKIADELGYHDGLNSPEQVRRFLVDSERAVHKVAPATKLLVDVVVPELGCLPWVGAAEQQCAAMARKEHPAITEAAITTYLKTGAIDVLDLSTGLLDAATYQSWGLDLRKAQQQAWAHVAASGWPSLTHLQGRKALAAAGGYQGSAGQAADDVATYVDMPTGAGAGAIDIWAWRQEYQGQTVSLLAPSLTPNPLWSALEARHRDGVRLITHMSPSSMPTDATAFGHECDVAAQVFDEVFVAAGTG